MNVLLWTLLEIIVIEHLLTLNIWGTPALVAPGLSQQFGRHWLLLKKKTLKHTHHMYFADKVVTSLSLHKLPVLFSSRWNLTSELKTDLQRCESISCCYLVCKLLS
jgi:hypothetical protein